MTLLRKITIPSIILLSLFVLYFQRINDSVETIPPGLSELKLAWTLETKETITSSPAVDYKDHVYIRTAVSVIALDIQNGNKLWEVISPSNLPLSLEPQVFEDFLIVPEEGSRLAVFNAVTGQLLWRSSTIEPEFTHPDAIEIESIAVADGVLLIARFNWTLTAYRLTDGRILWEEEIFGRSNPYLVSDQTTVYLGMGSMIQAFDHQNGDLLWQEELNGYIGPMLRIDNILYVLDEMHSSLYAIDLSTQQMLWNNIPIEAEEFSFECISTAGDKLLVAAQELIVVSTSSGQTIWSTKNLGRLECPTVLNNEIFVRNTQDTLYTFDLSTGEETSRLRVSTNTSLKHEPDRSPVSASGLLILPVNSNRIAAFVP